MAKLINPDKALPPLYVDLEKCDGDDPCAYDNTCRIHKLYGFLKSLGVVEGVDATADKPKQRTLDEFFRGAMKKPAPADPEGE